MTTTAKRKRFVAHTPERKERLAARLREIDPVFMEFWDAHDEVTNRQFGVEDGTPRGVAYEVFD